MLFRFITNIREHQGRRKLIITSANMYFNVILSLTPVKYNLLLFIYSLDKPKHSKTYKTHVGPAQTLISLCSNVFRVSMERQGFEALSREQRRTNKLPNAKANLNIGLRSTSIFIFVVSGLKQRNNMTVIERLTRKRVFGDFRLGKIRTSLLSDRS